VCGIVLFKSVFALTNWYQSTWFVLLFLQPYSSLDFVIVVNIVRSVRTLICSAVVLNHRLAISVLVSRVKTRSRRDERFHLLGCVGSLVNRDCGPGHLFVFQLLWWTAQKTIPFVSI
jgi:hypothetical protein